MSNAILIQKGQDVTVVVGFFNPLTSDRSKPNTSDPIDISGWTSAAITLEKPDGTDVDYTNLTSPAVANYTDGTDGYIKVDVPNATVDTVSQWRVQAKVVKSSKTIITRKGTFIVEGTIF